MLPDGSGRVRIHFFVHDEKGPAPISAGSLTHAQGFPMRGRIACQPERMSIMPEVTASVIRPVVHSNDARAVTCPECQATDDYKAMMKDLAELVNVVPALEVGRDTMPAPVLAERT